MLLTVLFSCFLVVYLVVHDGGTVSVHLIALLLFFVEHVTTL